jgi:hypothetical protein
MQIAALEWFDRVCIGASNCQVVQTIVLSDEEATKLVKLARSKVTRVRLAQRAQIVLRKMNPSGPLLVRPGTASVICRQRCAYW